MNSTYSHTHIHTVPANAHGWITEIYRIDPGANGATHILGTIRTPNAETARRCHGAACRIARKNGHITYAHVEDLQYRYGSEDDR